MAEVTRKTVMAIKAETTEGTPVSPTSASSYIALQDGFEVSPAIDTIDNNELRSSIGRAAPILGLESPTVSISHYIRHSHVENTEPNFGILLKNAFGDKATQSTERATTSGSTAGTSTAAAVIALAAGGSDFERGKAMLIKDGTNGYSIRPTHSVSSNNVTLGFNLANAPGTGVNTGLSILYKPADTQESLSVWTYRANGAAVELVAGSKVNELSIEGNVGEPLNGSFSLDGSSYYFNPVEITATDTKLDFLDNVTTRVATVTAKFYKDPHDLASALQTSMNSLGSANTFTVTYSDTTGKYTIASNGSTLSLLWNTGGNTANTIGDKIGFSTAADDTGALTYTSDNAFSLTSPQTPSFDAGQPLVVKNMELMIGDFDDYGCSSAQSFSFKISNTQTDVKDVCAESGVSSQLKSAREVEVGCVFTLAKYDADKFRRFRTGDNVRFGFNFGTKSGGNWVAGKCGNIYVPTGQISEFKVSDADGIVTFEILIKGYVDSSGNGEAYLSFV